MPGPTKRTGSKSKLVEKVGKKNDLCKDNSSTSSKRDKEEKSSRKKRRVSEKDVVENAIHASSSSAPPLLKPRPGWDTIFFFFFLTHVHITVLWHSQMILPAWLYPQCLRDLTKTYSKDWQDPLNFSAKTPVWYLSIIYCELFFQLPFHFIAIYVFWTGSHFHPWFRIPSIMYSIHVATTFMPIFTYLTSAETLTRCNSSRGSTACALAQTLRLKLIAVYYAPFFLIPLRLLTFSVFRTYDSSGEASDAGSRRTSRSNVPDERSVEPPISNVGDEKPLYFPEVDQKVVKMLKKDS